MSVLQAIDLKKYYGTEPNITRALDGVNFSVEDGEFVAVVGTSGSGKSTLLHMMGGLDTPTSGTVIVRGEELAKKNDEQRNLFVGLGISLEIAGTACVLLPFQNPYNGLVAPVVRSFRHRLFLSLGIQSFCGQNLLFFQNPCNLLRAFAVNAKVEDELRLLFPLRYPIICDTLYFGGMLSNIWI